MNCRHIFRLIDRAGIFLALFGLVLVLGLANPSFRSPGNLLNILQQSTPIGIAAIGMTFAIISGAFDLSVGSLMALIACVLVSLIDGIGFYPALLVALALGMACGLANGLIITRAGITPFIATLGTLWVFRALAYIYTENRPVQSANEAFISWDERFLGLPKLFMVMIAFYLLGYVILYHTPFGRKLFAVGSNPRAAILSGINVLRVRMLVFGLVGFFAALGGAMLSVRLWSAKASMAMGYELMIISSVVLGGTSLKGGSGTLIGTLGAALLFAVINNAMDMFQVQSYWQKIATGGILLLALSVDGLRQRFDKSRHDVI
ncbi:ABC transporter permease [Candidatus Sumerlaeota bacterium]